MIKKFKNFDVQEYLNSKSLKEAVDVEDEEHDSVEFADEDVMNGEAVYDNKYLLKITNIVLKRLEAAKVGDFGIYHDVVYLNGVPGVWFFGLDDNKKNIVCCRDVNIKTISVFDTFDVNAQNKALVTYSTEKLGFKDMIEQLIDDLQTQNEVSESIINEASFRAGTGYGEGHVVSFEKLSTDERNYVYDLLKKQKKSAAEMLIYSDYVKGDSFVVKMLNSFAGKSSAGKGNAKYLVGVAYDVMNGTYAASTSIFDSLIKEYKGGSPIITTSVGEEFDATDEDDASAVIAAREAKRLDALKEDTVKYEKTLRKLRIMSEAMCHYVKQNGKLDDDDASAMIKRGIFLTGKGGIGKSYTVEQVLEENHMVLNRDYVNVSSGSTTAESIYNYLYQYNDKLIIFDDSPDLFSTPKKIAVWKAALQSEGTEALVGYPLTTKDDTKGLYKTGNLTRQERYFKEMGRKSREEKKAYQEKRKKELVKELGKDYDKAAALATIEEEWKEIEAETVPLMPNSYVFNGVVIVIGNDTREEMRKQVGEGHWSAIVDRFQDYDLSPMSESIWAVIKKQILREYGDTSIPDKLCIIPRDLTEEFTDMVDSLISQPQYQTMTWRLIKAYGKKLRGKFGLEDWQEDLKNDMNTNK